MLGTYHLLRSVSFGDAHLGADLGRGLEGDGRLVTGDHIEQHCGEHLLARPQTHWLEDAGRQQAECAWHAGETLVHQLLILLPTTIRQIVGRTVEKVFFILHLLNPKI